jgi:hypothetical protein
MQNGAAKATCTGCVGTGTPGKAGSVSKETNPSAPEASTTAPKSREASSTTVPEPTAARLANSRGHQSDSHQPSS